MDDFGLQTDIFNERKARRRQQISGLKRGNIEAKQPDVADKETAHRTGRILWPGRAIVEKYWPEANNLL
ncbi:MAG: hypothetical protein JXM68_12215 [Sedimentisphaerales bacterium]|nr:hypothetical protein [Sedimentisphaerales bacterium]